MPKKPRFRLDEIGLGAGAAVRGTGGGTVLGVTACVTGRGTAVGAFELLDGGGKINPGV